MDIEPLIETHGMDISRFNADDIENIALNGDGVLFGLPFNPWWFMLYYNKDIFDQFAVPYPEDGLTWDETLDLATQLTREEDGMDYYGLRIDGPRSFVEYEFPANMNGVDQATNEPVVDSEAFRHAFEMYKQIYSIPGNLPETENVSELMNPTNDFIDNQNMAMMVSGNRLSALGDPDRIGDLNWDMAMPPTLPENAGVGMVPANFYIGVGNYSNHKDDAFRVIEAFYSDQAQYTASADLGFVPTLVEFYDVFGENNEFLQDKNLEGILNLDTVLNPPNSRYAHIGQDVVHEVAYEYVHDVHDSVETVIRVAEERIKQGIEHEMGQE